MLDTTQILPISIDQVLARNLVAARCALGWTQEALSAASRISRATIAQLESGSSDPRLSTVEALARTLSVPTALLLFGKIELLAFARAERAVPDSIQVDKQFINSLKLNAGSMASRDIARLAELISEHVQRVQASTQPAWLIAAVLGSIDPASGIEIGLRVGAALGSQAKD